MTIKDTYNYIKKNLKEVFEDDNSVKEIARFLFLKLYDIPLSKILSCQEEEILDFSLDELDKILTRIKKSEPLEYIFNSAQFLDLELFTESSVLIPRPETEELAIMVSKQISDGFNCLDIGVGSGCISIYCALKNPNAIFFGCDISEKAIKTAEKNIEKYNVKNLKLFLTDIFTFETDKQFDIIVSNPPYVKESEKLFMQKNVLDYEPFTALFVPDDNPLKFYKRITEFAETHLKLGGKIFFEINESLSLETMQILKNHGFKSIESKNDLFGKPRFVIGEK